jgi:hypothetical protein
MCGGSDAAFVSRKKARYLPSALLAHPARSQSGVTLVVLEQSPFLFPDSNLAV